MVQASEYGRLAADSRGFGWDGPAPQHDWATLIGHKDAEIRRLNGIYRRMLGDSGVMMHDAPCALHRAAHAASWRRDGHGGADRHRSRRHADDPSRRSPGWSTASPPTRYSTCQRCPAGSCWSAAAISPWNLPASSMASAAKLTSCSASTCHCAGSTRICGSAWPKTRRTGLRLHPSQTVHSIERDGDLRRVTLTSGHVVEADLVFFAVGRAPRTKGLGLERGWRRDECGGRGGRRRGERDHPAAHFRGRRRVQQAEPHPGGDRRGASLGRPAVRPRPRPAPGPSRRCRLRCSARRRWPLAA